MNTNAINVNEAETISLIPSEMKELQTRRFTEALGDIIVLKHTPKVKFEENLVTAARANTNKPLKTAQLNALCYFADSWNHDIEVSRSGEGLRIQFNLRK